MPTFQKPPTVNDDARAQDIYRRAAEIIYEKGFEATSMGDIADSVDLTKGGLYYYIKGKQALLYAIMSFALDLLEREVATPASREPDPEIRLSRLVSGYTRLMLREPCAMSILVSEDEGLDDGHRAKIRLRKELTPQLLSDAIVEVQDRYRSDPEIDPTVAAHSLLGMIHWVDRWYPAESRLSDGEVVEQITRLALHGLGPGPAPTAVASGDRMRSPGRVSRRRRRP